jgi:hypothetical protein
MLVSEIVLRSLGVMGTSKRHDRRLSQVGRMPNLLASVAPEVALASILGGKPHYIHFGWFLISVANLVVIVLMIVVFVLAIVLPFPGRHEKR